VTAVTTTTTPRRRGRIAGFVVVGLALATVLAGVVSGFASGEPDGLNKVAEDEGFIDQEQEHDLSGSPVAGYEVDGVDDDRLSTGTAGVIGVGITFLFGCGLFLLVRRRPQPDPVSADGG
jgi:PDGLE domain